MEHPNPPSHVVPCNPPPTPCPPASAGPLLPSPQHIPGPGPAPERPFQPEAPPTHVRARAPWASGDRPHIRPIPGKLGSGVCLGEGCKGRVRAELEQGGPGRGRRVSWTTSDQTLGGEPVGASSFGPRGPDAVIGSHARAELSSASPPCGQRKQRLLGTRGLLPAARDPGTRRHLGDLLSNHRPLPSMDWRTGWCCHGDG